MTLPSVVSVNNPSESDKRSVLYLNPIRHYCREEVIKSL